MNRLRYDLADLADEVVNVDLSARARRTSQKMRNRRAALATGAAVLVVLAGMASIAYALSKPQATAPVPASSSSAPAAEPSSAAAPSQSSAAPASAKDTVLAGTRWYGIRAVTGTKDVLVKINFGGVANDEANCVSQTVTVSPGGKRIAWAEGSGDTFSGTLKVATADGKNVQTLATGAVCLGASALRWKGDDSLFYSSKDGGDFLMNIPNHTSTKLPEGEQFDGASPDGKWTAKQVGDQRFVTDGKTKRVYTYKPPAAEAEHYDGWSARAVSADGRYITVGWHGTDPGRQEYVFAIVDTTTNKAVNLPWSDQQYNVIFTAGGLVLVHRNGTTVIFDAKMQKVGEAQEPASVKDAVLLGFTKN